MATSPMAENRAASTVISPRVLEVGVLFFCIEHRIGIGVVVHFHLSVYLHVFSSGGHVGEEVDLVAFLHHG